jgi:hypothetical protein
LRIMWERKKRMGIARRVKRVVAVVLLLKVRSRREGRKGIGEWWIVWLLNG